MNGGHYMKLIKNNEVQTGKIYYDIDNINKYIIILKTEYNIYTIEYNRIVALKLTFPEPWWKLV
jgi:hypothetical protein